MFVPYELVFVYMVVACVGLGNGVGFQPEERVGFQLEEQGRFPTPLVPKHGAELVSPRVPERYEN